MRCKIVNIDKEKGIVIHEYIDQIYLKAQISRSFDINSKAYDENNEIGMFDREAITLDDIYNHITRFSKSIKPLSQKLLFVALRHRNFCANFAYGKTVLRFKTLVMWTPALGHSWRKMKTIFVYSSASL